ncbi:hypothetical protein [Streptomyces griseorubiginosus]|uniref:hypothetical protein n=1 Tax=Streptomyces griseorubiginosus TaxID=67304 RepID=UPI001AD61D96|nr:hypothetical protein [Streptomyces griseorubiginosus]MBO4253108.1 hypothetical protein [Streptomyces griseorubiginosus]
MHQQVEDQPVLIRTGGLRQRAHTTRRRDRERGGAAHDRGHAFEVEGLTSDDIGTVARKANVILYELAPQTGSLEEAYMALTEDSVEHRAKEAT